MTRPLEYFRSVELVWPLWLASVFLLAYLTRRALRDVRWRDCLAFLAREDGAAYSISYVMTFPIYLLLVCLIVDCTLLLVVKMGTVYAAYAGARSNAVWLSAEPNDPERVETKRRRAVTQALAPFANSSRLYAERAGLSSTPSAEARAYADAYQEYAHGPAGRAYLERKYDFANSTRITRVETIDRADNAGEGAAEVTVRVSYEMPFHVPAIGRILGHRPWPGARLHTYAVVSEVTLQKETPKNARQTLGIDYHVPD